MKNIILIKRESSSIILNMDHIIKIESLGDREGVKIYLNQTVSTHTSDHSRVPVIDYIYGITPEDIFKLINE